MKYRSFFLSLLLFILSVLTSPVYSYGLPQENKTGVNLAPHVDIYIDEEGLLVLDDVLSAPINDQFQANNQHVPNLGFSGAAGWFRIALSADTALRADTALSENTALNESSVLNVDKHPDEEKTIDVKWLLEIPFPLAEEVSFFIPLEKGGYQEIKTGMDYPFSSRSVDHPNFVFPLGTLTQEKTFYLRVRSTNGALQVPLIVWEESLFEDYADRSLIVWGGVYGIIIVMCFYNLLIFVSVRDITYLFYILYALGMAGTVLVLNGLGFQYFWPDLPDWNDRVVAFFVGIMTFFAICFCRRFNLTSEYAPRLDQYLKGLSYVSILITILSVSINYNLSLVSTLMVTVFSLSMLATGVYSVRLGVRSSKYFLFAWITFIGGMLIYTLSLMDIIPVNIISSHGKEVGALLEMILLSLGLADRINVEKEERLGAIKLLERSENRYRSMFEKAVEGRFQLDKNLHLIEYNASFIEMFNYDKNKGLSKNVFKEIWAKPEMLDKFVALFERKGVVDSYACQMQTMTGNIFDAEMTVSKDLDHRGEIFFYGALSDVSEKKKIAELERKRHQAEEVSEAKSIFLATMSHELRRPINTIYGFSQLIREKGVEVDELKKFNQRIYTSSMIMRDVVNNLLDFSKIEAGVLEVNSRHFNLALLANVIMETCSFRATERDIEFVVSMSDNLPKEVVGDEYHLRQVLINLVDNGIKFTKEGRVELKISHRPGDYKNDIVLRFEVSDTGVGISESFQKTLFDKFSQEPNEDNVGGTGLGLYVAKEYVDALGGELQLKSELGAGSCFQFEIVVARPDDERDLLDSRDGPMTTNAELQRGGRILLAEDDAMTQEMVLHFLEGYEVTVVQHGEAVVAAVCDREFDLVLMDLRMPQLDGIRATKKIREIFTAEELPIVAMSGNAFSADIEECLEAGMNDHIAKPVKRDDLIHKIQRQLARTGAAYRPLSRSLENSFVHRLAKDNHFSFDLISMYSTLGENEELLVSQLRHFLNEYGGYVVTMDGLLGSEDYRGLSHYVHKLKSSALLLGATELATCCEEMELLLEDKGFDGDREKDGLKSQSIIARSLLAPVLDSVDTLLELITKESPVVETVDVGTEEECG